MTVVGAAVILAAIIAVLLHLKVARASVVIVCVYLGLVLRSTPIGDGVNVSVNVLGPDAFSTADDDLFTLLTDAVDQLRNSPNDLSATIDRVDAIIQRMSSAEASIGSRRAGVDASLNSLSMSALNNKTSLSNVENVDIAAAIMDVQMQTTAYQAALGATAKVIQPSLLDFLR